MDIYLVGGAVRDRLLGLPIKEKDWVVVGSSIEEMLRLGFKPVGKDFPVFLHPQTKEEYALARTERKIGRGYAGFVFNADPDVTLEEDLKRRDLTINAMAEDAQGNLIDPYGGSEDLKNKKLKHVSLSFIEDPVRVLRVARFAARFYELGFSVAFETNKLMQQIVRSGEIDSLVAERVWKELERALAEKNPEQFFQVLAHCDALTILFPSIHINNLGLKILAKASVTTEDVSIRFAVLVHDLKLEDIRKLCERYRVPRSYCELALLVAGNFSCYQSMPSLSSLELLNLFKTIDVYRREDRFKKFLVACEIITEEKHSQFLINAYQAIKDINIQSLLDEGFSGKVLADKINQERLKAIEKLFRAC